MGINPCCCWNIKDGAVTVGLWSLVYSLASLILFGWQLNVINSCQSVTMSQANLQCVYWCPCAGASNERTSALIESLFVIQILCLIAAFFLLFASIALIYGAHTFSRCLIWPWIPCMIANVLCSLAYCIIWWSGDVRDYWLILTIIEMIIILINVYCLFVIMLFYRRMSGEIVHYKNKNVIRYDPDMYDEYRKDNYQLQENLPGLDYPVKSGYKRGMSPRHERYNRLPDYGSVTHLPSQSAAVAIAGAQKTRFEDDMLSSWIKEQQELKEIPDHANSEPVTPAGVAEQHRPLHHAYSVPSMFVEPPGGTKCSHRCRKHHHHRRRQSSSGGHRDNHASNHHHRRRRSSSRHRDRSDSLGGLSQYSCSSDTASTDFTGALRRQRNRSQSRDRYSENDSEETNEYLLNKKHRKHREAENRSRDHRRGPKRVKRNQREKDDRGEFGVQSSGLNIPSPTVAVQTEKEAARSQWPLNSRHGGFTFPQQIIIPPSNGANIDRNGQPEPQTYQINSEIRISYDRDGRPMPPLSRNTLPSSTPTHSPQGTLAQQSPQPQLQSLSKISTV